jgi:hypothetical protein
VSEVILPGADFTHATADTEDHLGAVCHGPAGYYSQEKERDIGGHLNPPAPDVNRCDKKREFMLKSV